MLGYSVNGDFKSVGLDYSVGDGDMLCTFSKVYHRSVDLECGLDVMTMKCRSVG